MLGFLVKRPVDSGGSCTLRQRLLFVFCWYTMLMRVNCEESDSIIFNNPGGIYILVSITTVISLVAIIVVLEGALQTYNKIFKPRKDFNKTVTAFFLASNKAKSVSVTMNSTDTIAGLRKQLHIPGMYRVHQAHDGNEELKDEDQLQKLLSEESNGNSEQNVNVVITKGHDTESLFVDADQGVSSKTVALVTQTKANIIVSDFITSLGLTATTVFEADAEGTRGKELNDQLSDESKEIPVTVMYGGRNTIILAAGVLQGDFSNIGDGSVSSTGNTVKKTASVPDTGNTKKPPGNKALDSKEGPSTASETIKGTELKHMEEKVKKADGDDKKGKSFQNKVSPVEEEQVAKDEGTSEGTHDGELKADEPGSSKGRIIRKGKRFIKPVFAVVKFFTSFFMPEIPLPTSLPGTSSAPNSGNTTNTSHKVRLNSTAGPSTATETMEETEVKTMKTDGDGMRDKNVLNRVSPAEDVLDKNEGAAELPLDDEDMAQERSGCSFKRAKIIIGPLIKLFKLLYNIFI